MIQSSKMWRGFTVSSIIFVLIFITGIVELLSQTTDDDGIEKDKSSSNTTNVETLFGINISLKGLSYIGTFLLGIAAIIALILHRKPPPIQIVVPNSVDIENLLKNRQSDKYLQVEKVVQKVEQDPKASYIKKALADAYRLQQNEKIDETREKWRSIADYAEGNDDDLAKQAGVSIGYLMTKEERRHASHTEEANLTPDDAEMHFYSGLGKYAGEGIVIGVVLRYFNGRKFKYYSTALEYNVGGHNKADVVLLNDGGKPTVIVECKRVGYDSKIGISQLTEYMIRSNIKLGVFAADLAPSRWTFLKILGDEITEISRSEFETAVVESGTC